MKGSIWVYSKSKDSIQYYFQVDGIKRGAFTKVIDPVFKEWKEVGSGVNYKKSTETLIFTKPFMSDEEMISWVKKTVEFPTTFSKCTARCANKVLVEDKKEVKNEAGASVASRAVRKTKTKA